MEELAPVARHAHSPVPRRGCSRSGAGTGATWSHSRVFRTRLLAGCEAWLTVLELRKGARAARDPRRAGVRRFFFALVTQPTVRRAAVPRRLRSIWSCCGRCSSTSYGREREARAARRVRAGARAGRPPAGRERRTSGSLLDYHDNKLPLAHRLLPFGAREWLTWEGARGALPPERNT